ncbi:MAG: CehA/McbA family metallohydrolase [Desulfatiglandales bacterium]
MFDFEYIGNLHIHSRYSDGTGTVQEIKESAIRAGLDFIALNDHDFMMDEFHIDEEGFYGKTMVLVGIEIGREDHHYLAYGIREMIRKDELSPQQVIDRVRVSGGIGFLAHPFEKGMPFLNNSKAYKWKDLSVTGYQGLSIWNFSSRWKERVKSALHGMVFLCFRRQLLKGPSRRTLAFWDRQCQHRRVAAIGASDAHGSLFTWGPIRFRPFSYDFLLNTINVHVLLNKRIWNDFEAGKEAVYEALKEGRLFIAHDGLCPAKGFRFDFMSTDGSDLVMGEEGTFQKGEFVIELPRPGKIRLIKDGRLTKTWRGREAVYKVREKGVYRVEVYRRIFLFGWRPWIFSNPIYLR